MSLRIPRGRGSHCPSTAPPLRLVLAAGSSISSSLSQSQAWLVFWLTQVSLPWKLAGGFIVLLY